MSNRPQRPKFLWNTAYLERMAIELGDECIFLCLSPVSFRMLTDMSKMLLWATRYEDREVPDIGKTAYRELNVPCLTDFYSLLDELNNKDWLQSQFDDLGSRMTELEEMDVIVNQTVNSCGCGCEDGTTTTTTNTVDGFTIDPEDTGVIPPYNTEDVIIVDIAKCRAANHLARMVSETIRAMAGRLGGGVLLILGITEVLIAVLSWVDVVPGDEVVGSVIGLLGLITIAQAIARMAGTTAFTWGVIDELAEFLESPDVAQSFVCTLYDWNNAQELGNALTGFLNAQINLLDTTEFIKDAMIDVFDLLFDPRIINWYVENINAIVPADFVPQYDCICGATGDSCPTQNIVLAGVGALFTGDMITDDLTGTTQGFGSQFNSTSGYYEVIFELAANYCVTIENGAYTPEESHEKCSDGVMVPSDGSCIRRFVARSQSPFGTAVTFNLMSENCECVGEFADLSPCGYLLENAVGVTSTDVPGGDTELTATHANGVTEFEFVATGHTVASTPRATLVWQFADDSNGLSIRAVRIYDVVIEGVANGAYIDTINLPAGMYPQLLAGTVASSDRACVDAEILAQLGQVIVTSDDVTKGLEIGAIRPGDGNFTRITGKIEFYGEPLP